MGIKLLQEQIAPYLPSAPVIVEAGAHIGRDTRKMCALWPHGTIHAFEPVPQLFEQLKKNTEHCSNVACYPYALSDKAGKQTMYVSSGRSTATSSLLEPFEYAQEFPTTLFTPMEVPTITLDCWAQQQNISHVDFMWLDMQGGELAALQGATQLLPTVSCIYLEFALTYRYKNNPLFDEVRTWLAHHGFSCKLQTLIKSTWGNALFVRAV